MRYERPWWWPTRQPAAPSELNEPDEQHTERVATRRNQVTGQPIEAVVYVRAEAVAHWDVTLWRGRP